MAQKKKCPSPADKLRALLDGPEMMVISACYDALSARLIEMAGMPASFYEDNINPYPDRSPDRACGRIEDRCHGKNRPRSDW